MSEIKYPPKGMITPSQDIEYTILWMLSNNKQCGWADFLSNQLPDDKKFGQSSLSKYLNSLQASGFVRKEGRGVYKITPEGRQRFSEIETKDELDSVLNYPPEKIKEKRNYEDCILWMLYNNNHCKWSDFQGDVDTLYINQSSLSKSLKYLMNKSYVENNNHEYQITTKGEIQYLEMLKKYDLDRQSILDEESKRVEVITDKVSQFFEDHDINDDGIMYRFLNMVMRLDYTKFEATISDEEDIDKILLFLAINHPDNYPNYIKLNDFAKKYDIKLTTLQFFIDKIVEEKNFAIRF
ncbi:MAG: hypothetical protein ACFE96_14610, partial [Candidatus Hermodarchaeota archaeon]